MSNQSKAVMKHLFEVKKPLPVVFNYLSDMQKFASLHPVIQKISELGDNHYRVYETLKAYGIPFSFSYPATTECLPLHNKVTMRATVMKLTSIEITFAMRNDNGITFIEESLVFKSVLPVSRLLFSIFKKQHEQLFSNMEAVPLSLTGEGHC